MQEATLCLLLQEGNPGVLLLGKKKRGFGKGKIVGFGGKIEHGETSAMAAVRELEEETGLRVREDELHQLARLTFLFPARPEWNHLVAVYVTTIWHGDLTESHEITPAWFRLDAIPFEEMWDDAYYWMPYVLNGKRIQATFTFNDDNESVDRYVIEPWTGKTDTVRKSGPSTSGV
ncbi:MAG: NUDIX domain-containing protein [Chloroflexota bacterium]|nr:NUDIX domain-containing protein [Chloroflexota bacterium]